MTLGYSPTKQPPKVYVMGKSITFRKVIKQNETHQQGTLTSNTSQTSSQNGKDCPIRALKTFVDTCVSPLVKKYKDESTQDCSSLMLREEYQENKMRAYQSQSVYGGDSEIDFSQKSRYSQITSAKLLSEKSRYKGLNLNSILIRIEKKKWISTKIKNYGRDIFKWQGTKSLIGITEEQCWLFTSSGDYDNAQFKYILFTSTFNGKPSEIKTPLSKAKSSLVKTHQKAKASESTKTTKLKLSGATKKRTNRVLKDEEDYLYSDEDLKHAKGKNSRQKTTSITDVFKSHKPEQFIPNDETFGLEDVSDDDSLFNRKSMKPTSGKNSSKKRQEKQQAKEVRVSDLWEGGVNFQLENELNEAIFGINPAKISRTSETSKEAAPSANIEQEVKKPKTQGRKQKLNYEMASGISIVHKAKAKQQRATYQEEQIQRSLSIFTTASIKHNQSDQEEEKGETQNASKQQLEAKKQSPEPKQPKKVGRPKSSPIVKKQKEEQKVQSGKSSASKQAPNGKSLLSSKFNPATIKPMPVSQLPTKQISLESQEDNFSPEQRSNPQGGGSKALMKILCKRKIDKQELDLEVSDHKSGSHDSQQNSDEQEESDYANNEYEEDSEGETQKRHSESDHWGSHIRSMKDEDLIAKMNYSSRGGESSFDIKKGDFMRLLPSVYLNDVLINFYLKFLECYVYQPDMKNDIYMFNSYFMQKLKGNTSQPIFNEDKFHFDKRKGIKDNYSGVKRWTRGCDLFTKKYLMVPICEAEHWSLAIICNPGLVKAQLDIHIERLNNGFYEGLVNKKKDDLLKYYKERHQLRILQLQERQEMLANRRALILKRKEEQKLKEIQVQSSHKMEDTEMKDETCNPQKEECMKDLNVEDPNQSTSAPEILQANNQQIMPQINQKQRLCYKNGQNKARYRGQFYNDQGYVSEEYGAESDEEEELDQYDEGSYGMQRPSKKRDNKRRQRLLQEDDDQQSEDVRMRGESDDEYDQEEDPYGEEYDSNEDEEEDNVGEEPSIEMVEAEAKQWVQRGEWDIGKKQFHTAVDHNKPYILYLDSMNVATESLMLPLRTYIEMEYLEKKLPPDQKKYFTEECYWRGFSQWTMPTYQPAVPKQNNSFDCGLFLLEYAEIFAENPIFILENLRQEGVELFKEEWIDMKRDIVKRLIIALQTPMPVQEIGINYSNWRQKQQLKYTHQICTKNKLSGLTPIKLLGELINKDQGEFPSYAPTNLISPNV